MEGGNRGSEGARAVSERTPESRSARSGASTTEASSAGLFHVPSSVMDENSGRQKEMMLATLKVLEKATLDGHVHRWTLRFKSEEIETLFRHRNALLHRETIYAGFFLQLVFGVVFGFGADLLGSRFKVEGCNAFKETPEVLALCRRMLNNHIIAPSVRQAIESEDLKYPELGQDMLGGNNNERFGVTESDQQQLGGYEKVFQVANVLWTFVFVSLGALAHWRIHYTAKRLQPGARLSLGSCVQLREVEGKKWATVSASVIYAVGLAGYCGLAIGIAPFDSFWELRLYLWYAFTYLFAVFFTGMLFWQVVGMSIAATICFYALTIPIFFWNLDDIVGVLDAVGEIEPVFEMTLYSGVAILNVFYTFMMVMSAYSNEVNARRSFLQEFFSFYQQDKVLRQRTEKGKLQEQMLNRILPPAIVKELTSTRTRHDPTELLRTLSHRHESVSILFADVVGFSTFAKDVESLVVMEYLNKLFEGFDRLCDEHNAYKVETIGDCYVATVGLVTGRMLFRKAEEQSAASPGVSLRKTTEDASSQSRIVASERSVRFAQDSPDDIEDAARENTRDLTLFAKAMICQSKTVAMAIREGEEKPTSMRVGIHTGSCLSGIVGTRNLRFCVLGESVRVAQKLEESGKPDHLHASHVVRALVPGECWRPSNVTFGEKETYLLKPFVE